MSRISKKTRSNKKTSTRRTPRRTRKSCTGLVSTSTSLNKKERSEAVKVYIDQIVVLKINSEFDNNRVPRETYKKYFLKMKRVGIDWLTIDALKLRVNRAFNNYVKKVLLLAHHHPRLIILIVSLQILVLLVLMISLKPPKWEDLKAQPY